MADPQQKGERVLRGIPVSAGVSRGKILLLQKGRHFVPKRTLTEDEVTDQISRLQKALSATRQQIAEVQRKVANTLGADQASIFDAHLLVLEDPSVIDEVVRMVQEQKVNVEHAYQSVAERYTAALAGLDDEYLRERASDMRDVSSRVLNNLMGLEEEANLRHLTEPCIIISHDLTPSDTAQLDKQKVLGFATDVGSKTSHTAIMARSLGISAVVGLKNITEEVESGQYALIDGFNGHVIINPTDQTLFEYGQLIRKNVALEEKLREAVNLPTVTLDGVKVALSANIESSDDIEAVKASGAEGVGLFRTEYLFIKRTTLPTEAEQYEAYRKVAASLKPHHVVIRTLDLGGDKFLSHLASAQEMNPFMGWRAIRFCLQQRDLFRTQLRAILRASAEGNIKMMYPMISGLDEFNQANALVDAYKAELRNEGIPFDEQLQIGAMIEIPSAAVMADSLGKHAKFFSIGTNDLIQYSLAVDRLNERIAHLYEPTHPAIIRLIKTIVDGARHNQIPASVCGEMAGEPVLVPLLLGLGVDELSAAPPLVPQIKFLVRRLKLSEARALADFALTCENPVEILSRCQGLAQQTAPSLFENQT